MTSNPYYIKDGNYKFYIIDNGVSTPFSNTLEIAVYANGESFERIKELFSGKEIITIYGCVRQEDGRETDEFISSYFEGFTFLQKMEFDLENDIYKLTLIIPDETQERLSELEDAVNFLLMEV